MIYTDNVHVVADSLSELHEFARKIGLKRFYFHGVRKGHPHYDITNQYILKKALKEPNLNVVTTREILIISKNLK
jgi:hypothetical protein